MQYKDLKVAVANVRQEKGHMNYTISFLEVE